MSALEAIALAVIQGLTEFLPVSSSGHLALGHWLFGVVRDTGQMPLEFVVLVHFGTLVAVVAYYRSDLVAILRDIVAPQAGGSEGGEPGGSVSEIEVAGRGRRLFWLLVVATVPAGLALPVKGYVEALFEIPWAVGAALLVTGTALILSERLGRRVKDLGGTTYLDAVLLGIAELLAVMPGISRSGATIAAGLGVGFRRGWSVRFAFLMSVPAILAGTVVEIPKLIETQTSGALGLYLLCGAIAGVTGYFAIRLVIGAVQSRKLKWFAAYCYVVGALAIIGDLFGLL